MSLQVNDRLLFPKGKRKAFTLSYDDGIQQDRKLVTLLDTYHIKATFNLNPGLFGQRGTVAAGKKEVPHIKLGGEDARQVYKNHEIAAHGQYHVCMTGMDPARAAAEALDSRRSLEELLQKPVTGYAYAFGAHDDTTRRALQVSGIRYARTITSTYSFAIPQDFLTWDPTCHHNDEKLFALADSFLSDDLYFSLLTPAKLFYVWGHSYEFDQCENWEYMERFLEKMSGHADVWYATNGEIQEYVEAYRRLIFSADAQTVYNPSAVSVYIGGMFTQEYVEVQPGKTAELIPPVNM
ncbi:polysaccharide deacetylase family protein [Faecalicatena acetigenes]|uniref:Polysaccharide deacetylase family protein n=1 Tax=Faecalicatena acetigenes TaxID=2981790 RepID=A0ABT2T818_9FIRM|nr:MULTISPECIES: polysaccharide deacetylase family protein [Lachnospiraceae]MCU6746136.1 polysaccharide deacetylase family protein [Faecalicatena acetigenes]SCG97305.1 Polysaccharide deacetylase [uncultured Clostridium sp.]